MDLYPLGNQDKQNEHDSCIWTGVFGFVCVLDYHEIYDTSEEAWMGGAFTGQTKMHAVFHDMVV